MYAETYSFGMLMPNRSFNADGQIHLYHGMEQDMEVSGSGNSYTTEFRQYDPRLGRWKSLDPLMSMFPDVSPYNAFANNPIVFTDPYGLAPVNEDGGGDPVKKGDVIIGDDGKEYTATHDEFTVTAKRKSADSGFERKSDDTYVQPSDRLGNNNISIPEYESQEEYNEKLWRRSIEEINSRPQATMKSAKTDGQKLAEHNLKLYGPVVIPGFEIAMKMKDGEQIDASDWIIEGINIIPVGKIFAKGGKLFLKQAGKKPIDITKKNLIQVCFIAGTPIATEDGIVPIEDIEVGDLVWAFDEETGDVTFKTVYNTVVRETDHLEKLVIGTDTLHTTSNHPFWVSNTWKPAGELVVGDTLTLRNNEKLILNYKEKIDTIATVYNFAVSDYATYFVGEQEVLVHNDNGCAASFKTLTSDELAKRLGTTIKDFHKNIKPIMKKDFSKEMKKIGSTNPDIIIDKAGNIVLKNPLTGKTILTGVPLNAYTP